MTAAERAAALLAAGKLTTAQQVRAVELGWLNAAAVSAAAQNALANSATIRTQAQAAMATNTTYLGLSAPTNAQVAAQVKALTAQNQRLIRLALGLLDGTS